MNVIRQAESITAPKKRKGDHEPEKLRKGIFWDKPAGQYATRIGNSIDEQTAMVGRANVQRLGADPNAAIVEHARLMTAWQDLKRRWPELQPKLRMRLPSPLAEGADISRPFWLKPEWEEAANIETATGFVTAVEGIKQTLKETHTDLLPTDLRARVLQVLAPSVYEARGVAPDARRLTIRQAADEYKEWKRGKIGLKLRGRRSGGGIKASTFSQAIFAMEASLKLLDTSADLQTLNHDTLEAVIEKAYQKAGSPATARKWMVEGLKQLLDWAHRWQDIDFRKTDETDELFALSKHVSQTIVSYTADTVAKLKMLKQADAEHGGEQIWPFVLLMMNTGSYQVDVGSWTFDNLKVDGEQRYIWWQRVKSEHQNEGLYIRHNLWPETWNAIKPLLASQSKTKNPNRWLFVSASGGPLYKHVTSDTGRTDNLGLRFRNVLRTLRDEKGKQIDLGLSLKQFRKIALNAIKAAAGGNDDITRKFAGQRVPGVLKNYLVDEYGDVGAALATWRERLIADGIL